MNGKKLISLADAVLKNAYVPYSKTPRSVCILLESGEYVPGVRVENASFSLTVPALINALTTAAAFQRADIAAISFSGAIRAVERAILDTHPAGEFVFTSDRLAVRVGTDSIPEATSKLDVSLQRGPGSSQEELLSVARNVSSRAFIPESGFPVGCILELEDGTCIPAVNVEHPEWSFILCAERNSLTTAVSFGLGHARNMFLSCPLDETATPCGACRQVLVELAPTAQVWMDRGNRAAEVVRADDLLPGFFRGDTLRSLH